MTQVVVLPGLDGTSSLLADFCERLATAGIPARAIAYPPDRALDYAQLEPFVRRALPASGAFVLVGESFSGPLAIRIGADPPAGLVGLVLTTTFARSPVNGLSPFAPLVRFAPARLPAAVLRWSLLGRWATPSLERALADALRSVRPAVLRCRAAAALRVDVSELLTRIRVPVLQLVAKEDRLLSPSASRILADGLARRRTLAIAGPHLLLQTAPAECAAAVAAFAANPDSLTPHADDVDRRAVAGDAV